MSNIKLKIKHNQIKPPRNQPATPWGPKVILQSTLKTITRNYSSDSESNGTHISKILVWSLTYSVEVAPTQLDEKTLA